MKPAPQCRRRFAVDDLCRLIREVGQVPVERDALYRPVLRDGNRWWVDDGKGTTSRELARHDS